jgi:enamine deaminase RidA (YjgF/YER057c/UK114 family)
MQTTRSNPDNIARPVGAYSYAVRVHRADAAWIYVSGHIANDPEGTLVARRVQKLRPRRGIRG